MELIVTKERFCGLVGPAYRGERDGRVFSRGKIHNEAESKGGAE
jgi:hypothetical protein